MPTLFAKPIDNIEKTVSVGYTGGFLPGSPRSLVLSSGSGITIAAGEFIRVSIFRSGVPVTVLKATSISGSTLTIASVLDGYSDVTVNANDIAKLSVTAGTLSNIHTAVNALENSSLNICQGRLTVTSGDPIGGNTSAGSSTLYFTPFGGNRISLYNGSSGWDIFSFSELSISPPGTQGVYDVFAYNNSGTVALEFGPVWSVFMPVATDGTRATGYDVVAQDGIYVNQNNRTRRYLGSVYASGGLMWDYEGPDQGRRLVWNYYNRIQKRAYSTQVAQWTYNNPNARNWNANNRSNISVLTGKREVSIEVVASLNITMPSNNVYRMGIGYDRFNDFDAGGPWEWIPTYSMMFTVFINNPNVGFHGYYGVEASPNAFTATLNTVGTMIQGSHWC